MASKPTNRVSKLPEKRVPTSEDAVTSSGVRYITEDLLRKVSKLNNIEAITNLNLKLSQEGGKKIRYIENLEKCKRLQVLSLSCNAIEKIERLDKLGKLRELDISYNCLTKIEGLESLVSLSTLNLNGNNIETIPAWLPKKLKVLKVFKIARNQIHSLHEFVKLRLLDNLSDLAVAENPVTSLPHWRLFLVFHLRTLDTLDSQHVDWQERTQAQARFAQEELEELQKQLEAREAELAKLEEARNKSLGEIEAGNKTTAIQKEKLKSTNDKIKELQRLLQTKDDLLKRKTRELTQACEKHYELEQELAFYKIDHKFEQLGKPPVPFSNANSQEDNLIDGGLIGETPYIGKGRFHKHEMAQQFDLALRQGSPISNEHGGPLVDEDARQMQQALDWQLEDKKKAIGRAQDRLQHLHDELHTVEEQLSLATRELRRLQDTQPRPQLSEDDKLAVRSKLAKKINKVQQLRGEAERLESQMETTQGDMLQQQQDISHIREQLQRMGSQHQLYPQMQKEMADKQTQLQLSNQQYNELVAKLEEALATIAMDTADIQKLEQQLREGQIAQNEEMKTELEGIISGLQTYLQDVQQRSAQQTQDFTALLQEREGLQEQLQQILDENDQLRVTYEQLSLLQDRMASLEESLEDAREENVSLRQQLDETRMRDEEDADLTAQLQDAEQEILRLQQALQEADLRIQAVQIAGEEKLLAEKKQAQHLAAKVKQANDADSQKADLHRQLAQLQALNSDLQQQLYAAEQKSKLQQSKLHIDPSELKLRLDKVRRAVYTGQREQLGRSDDPVNQALDDLTNDLQDQLDKSYHETEQAQRATARAEQDIATLKQQLEDKRRQLQETKNQLVNSQQLGNKNQQLQQWNQQLEAKQRQLDSKQQQLEEQQQLAKQQRQLVERERQLDLQQKKDHMSQIDRERREMEMMRQEMKQLRSELEREKTKDMLPSRFLEASKRGQATSISATYRSSDTISVLSSTSEESLPSSEWSRRRHQLYDAMTPEEQDLFDELQREIEELRKLLCKKHDKKALDKMTQAEMTVNKLMGLMNDRHRRLTETDTESGQQYTRRSSKAATKNEAHDAKSQKKSYDDPRLQRAAHDLERALVEIDDLKTQLKEKDRQLKLEVKHSDKVNDKLDGQQEELARLHTVLDEHRQELENLRGKMDHMSNPNQDRTRGKLTDQLTAYDEELQQLQDSAALLRDTLATHGPRIQRLGNFGVQSKGIDYQRAGTREAESRRGAVSWRGAETLRAEDLVDGEHSFYRPPPSYPSQRQGYRNDSHGPPVNHTGSAPMDSAYQSQGSKSVIQGPYASSNMQSLAQSNYQPYVRYFEGSDSQMPAVGPQMGSNGPQMASGDPFLSGAQMAPAGTQMVPGPQMVSGPQMIQRPQIVPGPQMIQRPQMVPGPQMVQGSQMLPGVNMAAVGPQIIPSTSVATSVPHFSLAQEAVNPILPTTPTRIMGMSQPTTPVAGPGMGPAYILTTTPGPVNATPVMVSTPVQGDESLKGILKNGDDLENDLVCNVPDHQDLEEYTERLHAKIKSLKQKLKSKHSTKDWTNGKKKVIFEDDLERRTIQHLQAELQARRGDLESLDLAIERQKASLKHKRQTEKLLLSEREAAKQELRELKRNGSRGQHRKAFLNGDGDMTDDSDSDYDYDPLKSQRSLRSHRSPGSHRSARGHLQHELECLEHTLIKRRAELREADRLLDECQQDLESTRTKTQSTADKYQTAKTNLSHTIQDAEQLEVRARQTGRELVQAREQLAELNKQLVDTRQQHQQHSTMLQQIEKVIFTRDKEFQLVNRKLKEAKLSLEEVLLSLDEAKHHQVVNGRTTTTVNRGSFDLQEVEGMLRKHEGELDKLEGQLESELLKRQREVEQVKRETEQLQAEHDRLDQQVQAKHTELRQVQEEIEREEAVLQDLATTTNKQRSDLHSLTADMQIRQSELQSLQNKHSQKSRDLQTLKNSVAEEESSIKKLQVEKVQQVYDLEGVKVKVRDIKEEIEGLLTQRDLLEGTVQTLRQEKTTLEDLQIAMEKKLSQLKKSEAKTEESVQTAQRKLGKLETEMREMESEVEGLTREKSLIQAELYNIDSDIQERKSELEMIISEINEAEHQMSLVQQREIERRKITEEKFSSLEQRVREMGREIDERTEEKNMLVTALSRASEELQTLRNTVAKEREEMQQQVRRLEGDAQLLSNQLEDRSKEVKQIREKWTQEVMELEHIAQAHCSRANRLSDELSYLQAEQLQLQHRLKSQQEMEEKEKQLQENVELMKADIKRDLAGSLEGLELSHMESVSELERMQGQRDGLQQCLNKLKHNLLMIDASNKGTQKLEAEESKSKSENQFTKQQNFLMAQLREKVNRHADNFASKKENSYDDIRKLQLKLSTLEKIFAHEDLTHLASNMMHNLDLKKHDLELAMPATSPLPQEHTASSFPASRTSGRAYSPNRHSQQRQRKPSGIQIPEKDQ